MFAVFYERKYPLFSESIRSLSLELSSPHSQKFLFETSTLPRSHVQFSRGKDQIFDEKCPFSSGKRLVFEV